MIAGRLLWDAFVLPLPQAENAWRRWRESADLDRLDSLSFYLLPALAARMGPWLAGDPAQAILRGICRRTWSQNQLHRKRLADAVKILGAAGIERVAATGPVLWATLYWPGGAIRSLGGVDLLVEPASVQRALSALIEAGWKAPAGLPETSRSQFYFGCRASLRTPDEGDVRLHWRALPHTDFSLRRPGFPVLQPMPPGQIAPCAIPAEHSLVAALGGDLQDQLSWDFDAILIARQAGLDWHRVAALLRWRTLARNRLAELERDGAANVPAEVTRPPRTGRLENVLASGFRVFRRLVRS
jgi:hypothetical protein